MYCKPDITQSGVLWTQVFCLMMSSRKKLEYVRIPNYNVEIFSHGFCLTRSVKLTVNRSRVQFNTRWHISMIFWPLGGKFWVKLNWNRTGQLANTRGGCESSKQSCQMESGYLGYTVKTNQSYSCDLTKKRLIYLSAPWTSEIALMKLFEISHHFDFYDLFMSLLCQEGRAMQCNFSSFWLLWLFKVYFVLKEHLGQAQAK